jgi:hypothetical protein
MASMNMARLIAGQCVRQRDYPRFIVIDDVERIIQLFYLKEADDEFHK